MNDDKPLDEITIQADIRELGCGPGVPMTQVAINIRHLLAEASRARRAMTVVGLGCLVRLN